MAKCGCVYRHISYLICAIHLNLARTDDFVFNIHRSSATGKLPGKDNSTLRWLSRQSLPKIVPIYVNRDRRGQLDATGDSEWK